MATKKTGNSNGSKGGAKGGKKKMSTATKVEIGAGVLAAAAAAGAGYYFYGDKNAKKHRQAASKWTKEMKQEVVREAKKVKQLDQKAVARLVDRAAAAYQGVRSVDPSDLRQASVELKKHWQDIRKEIGGIRKSAAGAKKTVRKTAKKAAPKKAAPRKAAKKRAS